MPEVSDTELAIKEECNMTLYSQLLLRLQAHVREYLTIEAMAHYLLVFWQGCMHAQNQGGFVC